MHNTVTVRDRQTLFDIAIQTSGSVEAVFALAVLNGLSITDDVPVGTELITAPVINQDVVTYYAVNQIYPASADIVPNRGIDFDFIEFPEPVFTVG